MKITHTILFISAAVAFAVTGCDKKPGGTDSGASPKVVDEKTAIENFKNEIESTVKWVEEKQKAVLTDPVASMAAVGEIVAKYKGIKTDGLPADLKGAWGDMTALMTEMGDIFKGMPAAKPDKPEDATKAMGEIMPKVMALQGKIEPAAKKLEEIGKKYGIDMSKVGSNL